MPEPFKNFFNPEMIAQIGEHIARAHAAFDVNEFIKLGCEGLEPLELKERSVHIRNALQQTLPQNFREACAIILKALHPQEDAELSDMVMDDHGIRGWAIMPIADYVAQNGMDDFDFSLDVLAELTKRFSAEFAIRHFFVADWERTLAKAHEWSTSKNIHVRRFASEGSRPRLPWGLQIKAFVEDPAPLLPLLERLKKDNEEYVRRSVANNLNDIAKDHPDLVANIARDWLKDADKDVQRLVKHACRSLVKKGHKSTLEALGYAKPFVDVNNLAITTPIVKLGESLSFNLELVSTSSRSQPLIVDFIIHHQKANGTTSPMTFKWKIIDLAPGKTLKLSKKHPIKPVTTRTYYGGKHELEIQINGESFGKNSFELKL